MRIRFSSLSAGAGLVEGWSAASCGQAGVVEFCERGGMCRQCISGGWGSVLAPGEGAFFAPNLPEGPLF